MSTQESSLLQASFRRFVVLSAFEIILGVMPGDLLGVRVWGCAHGMDTGTASRPARGRAAIAADTGTGDRPGKRVRLGGVNHVTGIAAMESWRRRSCHSPWWTVPMPPSPLSASRTYRPSAAAFLRAGTQEPRPHAVHAIAPLHRRCGAAQWPSLQRPHRGTRLSGHGPWCAPWQVGDSRATVNAWSSLCQARSLTI